jgi:hypothetical protein
MSELGAFAEGLKSWRAILASVRNIEARKAIFANAAADIAGYTTRGLAMAEAVDALQNMAESNGLVATFGADEIQRIIGEAFDNVERVPDEGPRKFNGKQAPPPLPIMSKAEFIRGFRPPNYLVDGILQRRFVYALTGQTGHAKSAIALLLAQLVAAEEPNCMLGRHRVEPGQVAYFVGENPDDIRMRIIGADAFRGSANDRSVFIPGVFDIAKLFAQLQAELATRGAFDLIIIDTSAAYFLGNEELSNTQMGAHARMLRSLTTLPGGPCVLALCHPIKYAADPSQLLPRGGGAFLAEMDGNLTVWKHDDILVELSHNKIRGPGFEPISFRLETIRSENLVDAKGRRIPTVRAVTISESDEDQASAKTRTDEDHVLALRLKVVETDPLSYAQVAEHYGWHSNDGSPAKMRVGRIVDRLEKAKLVRRDRGQWLLTEKGKDAARKAALRFRAEADVRAQAQFSLDYKH